MGYVLYLVSFVEITQPLHLLAEPETGTSACLQNVIPVLAPYAIAIADCQIGCLLNILEVS